MRLTALQGTRDVKEEEVRAFLSLETRAREAFSRYGYSEIRTPIFERAELFTRAVGDATDIVEKEMYAFEDRGGRKLALRPEGTAGVVRAYLEHSWDKNGGIRKLFYIGPMFRADRPQAGRYREFWQVGAEFFGNPSPQADADVLMLVKDILESYGVPQVKFLLNSIGCSICRPAYREALVQYLESRRKDLCEDCQRRIAKNPLRALDCKTDGPKLSDAPAIADHLCEACRRHDADLTGLLREVGFDFEKAPRLVRGLDYYSRTVFEVMAGGSASALGAGGRYDNLVKMLGGPDVPAIGFALGMDRVARARYGDALAVPEDISGTAKLFIALAGLGTGAAGFKLLRDLRREGYSVEIGQPDKSLKAQMRWADGWGAGRVLIVGEEELKKGEVLLKDLQEHSQQLVKIDAVKQALQKTPKG